MKRITFVLCKIARFRREYCKLLSISNMWLHAQNSRISSQDFFVRSARSFERLEMQIL